SVFKQTSYSYRYSAAKEGTHTFCFSNQMSTMSHKTIQFTVRGPDEKVRFEDKYKDKLVDYHYDLVGEIERLTSSLGAMVDEQWYLRERLERHHKTASSTNSRVLWWGFFETLVLIGVCAFQVFYLTRFFEVKRMV
ncbi:p24 complex component, partial [Chytridiales sp. JEL 0842]